MTDDFKRQIVAPEIGQRAPFEEQSLIAHFNGEIGHAGATQDRGRACGSSDKSRPTGSPPGRVRRLAAGDRPDIAEAPKPDPASRPRPADRTGGGSSHRRG